MFRDTPAPNRARLSSVNLQRAFANEDWRAYNRLSIWMRPDFAGVPVLPLQIVLHNDGAEKVPDRYGREGTHYVTLARNGWQQIVLGDRAARARPRHAARDRLLGEQDARRSRAIASRSRSGASSCSASIPITTPAGTSRRDRIAFSHTGYQRGALEDRRSRAASQRALSTCCASTTTRSARRCCASRCRRCTHATRHVPAARLLRGEQRRAATCCARAT